MGEVYTRGEIMSRFGKSYTWLAIICQYPLWLKYNHSWSTWLHLSSKNRLFFYKKRSVLHFPQWLPTTSKRCTRQSPTTHSTRERSATFTSPSRASNTANALPRRTPFWSTQPAAQRQARAASPEAKTER